MNPATGAQGPYPPAYVNDPDVMARLQTQGERTQLKRELVSLLPTFNQYAVADQFSQNLLAWHEGFTEALENPRNDFHEIKTTHISKLQDLCCILPSSYVRTVKPHALGTYMEIWLCQQQHLPISTELEQAYAELKASEEGASQPAPLEQTRSPKVPLDSARLAAAARYRQKKMQAQQQASPHAEDVPLSRHFQNIETGSAAAIIADMNHLNAQSMQITARRIDVIAANQAKQLQGMQSEVTTACHKARAQQLAAEQELKQRAQTLKAIIKNHNSENRSSKKQQSENLRAQEANKQLAELFKSLAIESAESEARFQKTVTAINGNLAAGLQQQRHLELLQERHYNTMNEAIAQISQELINLQTDDEQLYEELQNLEAAAAQHQILQRKDARALEGMSSEAYYQQEINKLLDLLRKQPDSAAELIALFQEEMEKDFAKDLEQVATLDIKNQLDALQYQILNNSIQHLDQELSTLEHKIGVLQAQIDELPQAIENVARSQAELQKSIKMVKKLLKQQKKAMMDKCIKIAILTVSVVATGGAMAAVNLALTASGVDEKFSQMTQKLMKPMTKAMMKALDPVMKPINKIVAPLNKTMAPIMPYVGYINAAVGAIAVINNGGTWDQAGMSMMENLAPKSFAGQFANDILTAPLKIVVNEVANTVMRSAAPVLGAIQGVTTLVNAGQTLADALPPLGDMHPFSDAACADGFIGDIRRSSYACQPAVPQMPQASCPDYGIKGQAHQGDAAKGQKPAQQHNADIKGKEPSRLKPSAKVAVRPERQGPAQPAAVVTEQAVKPAGMQPQKASKAMTRISKPPVSQQRTLDQTAFNVITPAPKIDATAYRMQSISNLSSTPVPKDALMRDCDREFNGKITDMLLDKAAKEAKGKAWSMVLVPAAGCFVGSSIGALGGAAIGGAATAPSGPGALVGASVGAAIARPVGCRLGTAVALEAYAIYKGASKINDAYEIHQKFQAAQASRQACEAQSLESLNPALK
jgi:hypothetical protein